MALSLHRHRKHNSVQAPLRQERFQSFEQLTSRLAMEAQAGDKERIWGLGFHCVETMMASTSCPQKHIVNDRTRRKDHATRCV